MGGIDLAVLGNCQIAALLDESACILWCGWPRPDADPIFCALLDAQGASAHQGLFAIDLVERVSSQQSYERNTAIVTTVQTDRSGAEIRIIDFAPRFRSRGRIFRPATLVRIVEPLQGRPLLKIRLTPRRNYGAQAFEVSFGSHHVRYYGDGLSFRVTTDASLTALHAGLPIVLDRPLTFLLGPDETLDAAPGSLAREWLERTRDYWGDWVRTLAIPFDWQAAVIRAAITLKLCTYEDTGAVLAALTTSIPEAPDSGRNWDYRFCWLRDAFFVVQALNRLGATRTMEGFLRFIDQIVAQSELAALQPLYPLAGVGDLAERTVASLSGYRGMGPVRVGNQAAEQIQHDVYGSLVLAASQLFVDERLARPGDAALFRRLERFGELAVQACGEPDAGPWEFRGRTRPHTFSALMCWAACDRLARIASALKLTQPALLWSRRAHELSTIIERCAWDERADHFRSTLDGSGGLDATLLLLPEVGFISPQDPRFRKTLAAIERELLVDGHMMRYRHADDFGTPANAFNVCTFWYLNALAMTGQLERGRELFERLLACRNHVGLLSEDLDPRTGELWGNFPQTYSMVGIINSAIRLSLPWDAMV